MFYVINIIKLIISQWVDRLTKLKNNYSNTFYNIYIIILYIVTILTKWRAPTLYNIIRVNNILKTIFEFNLLIFSKKKKKICFET